MQRSNQLDGISHFTQFLFNTSARKEEISKLIRNRTDETYNIYLKTEIFDIDNEDRSEEMILDKISQVEFLQDIVEQYLQKKDYSIKLQEDEYKGIALIYELCTKILQVARNKLESQYLLYQEHINKGLIYNTLLCSIYYFCGKEIGMGQMIAEFFDKFNITSESIQDNDFRYMITLIDFFSLKRSNITEDDIIQILNDFSVKGTEDTNLNFNEAQHIKIQDCIGPDIAYFKQGLNVLREHSFQKHIRDQGGTDAFIGINNFSIRFLLPGQLEILNIIDQNNKQGVKSNIVTMPTSGGKSLIAELQIAKKLKEHPDKKIIYIAPKVALCDQITKNLQNRFGEIIEESYDDIFDEILGITSTYIQDHSKRIWILTPEKFLGIMSRGFNLDCLSLVVFDEFHNIATRDRGPKMELMMNIIKLKRKHASIDLHILLMSAMIDNGDDIFHWIDGEGGLWAKSEKSPTRKQLFFHNNYNNNDYIQYIKDIENDKCSEKFDTSIFLKNDLPYPKLLKYKKVLIYIDRVNAESGRNIEQEVLRLIENFELLNLETEIHNIDVLEKFSNLFTFNRQKESIKKGIGFYYKELDDHIKQVMINLFTKNIITVLVGNQAINEGLNLDIEYLIINSNPKRLNIDPIDLKNLIGRTGRVRCQTDGFVIIPQCHSKCYYNSYIKPLKTINQSLIQTKSFSGEKRITIKVEIIEQYFLIWLSNHHMELIEENIDEIIQDFKQELQQYFIGYRGHEDNTILTSVIGKVISSINLRKNFIAYQGYKANQFYKVTGMSQQNTRILIDKYDSILKTYRKDTIKADSGYNLDNIFPESFYPITIESEEITFENKINYSSYLLPWILTSYQRKTQVEKDFTDEQKRIISKKIEDCVLRIKYKVNSIGALQIMKKHHYSSNLSNLLANKGFDSSDDINNDILNSLLREGIESIISNEIKYHLLVL